MAYTREQLFEKRIQVKLDSIGGPTYFVDGEPTCLTRTRSEGREGMFCTYNAGANTDHEGLGRCYLHSGNAGRPPLTGRYAEVTKGKLRDLYQSFFTDEQMLDLSAELALQRTLLADAWERYQQDGNYRDFKAASDILNNVTVTVKKIEDIRSNKILTVSMAKLIMSNAVRIAQDFIPEGRMQEFMRLWREQVDLKLLKD